MKGIKLLFKDLSMLFGNKPGISLLILIFFRSYLNDFLGLLITNISIYIVAFIFIVRIIKKYLLREKDYKEIKKASKEFKKFIKNIKVYRRKLNVSKFLS